MKTYCLLCNIRCPKAVGHGVSKGFCSLTHYKLAWDDWIKSYRTCRFIHCDCPRDRYHTRKACRKKAPRHGRGILDGRCMECGHFPSAHQPWWRRSRSSFDYTDVTP